MKIIRAHIKDGVVVNMSAGDTDKPWTPPDGITIVELEQGTDVGIGHSWDGRKFSPPEPKPQVEDAIRDRESRITEMLDNYPLLQQELASAKARLAAIEGQTARPVATETAGPAESGAAKIKAKSKKR